MKNLFDEPKTVVILYADEGFYKMENAVSVRDALIQLADYFGDDTDLFEKAMRGMETEKDCIDCFNHFSWTRITAIYIIERTVYEND